MSLFSKRLMKWREPKIKGMVTPKNIVAALGLILIVSIPFGFLGGNGKFNLWICFLALGFMSMGLIGFLIQPLLPGAQIQLREDAIVRPGSKYNHRSAYEDIDCIYFDRDCSARISNDELVVNFQERSVEGPNFASFRIAMKNIGTFSNTFSNPVTYFIAPTDVNVEQVLQILRDKGVKVVECPLPS